MARYVNRLPGWTITLLLVLLVVAVAAVTRFIGLATTPPGFLLAEARTALDARAISLDSFAMLPGDQSDDSWSPLFTLLMQVTGSILGWDVLGARSAAALFGIVTAAACGLWYRRALGTVWGVVGGLLVATSFWQLMFSREAVPAIGGAAVAAVGLWCLWNGLVRQTGCDPSRSRRMTGDASCEKARERLDTSSLRWYAAAGLAFGAGVYIHPSFLPVFLVVPTISIFLLRKRSDEHLPAVDRRGIGIMLAAVLLAALPFVMAGISQSGDVTGWIEQDWDNDGVVEQVAGPADTTSGLVGSIGAFIWSGPAAASLNIPNRAIFDPILAAWMLGGLVVALRRPSIPLHGVALVWSVGFLLPAALVDPGNPQLLLPLTPVAFLFPLLAARELLGYVDRYRSGLSRLAVGTVALSLAGSAVWSLHDYFWTWAESNETYVSFNGDVRDALGALEQLPNNGSPVYFATIAEHEALRQYLAPGLAASETRIATDGTARRAIDSRTTLIVPRSGGGYLVYPTSAAPALLPLLDGQDPVAIGETANGDPAYFIWTVGQSTREGLPYTLPTIRFPHGFDLVGFSITPDIGNFATTGDLPDEPQVDVTLIWSAPTGVAPHTARIRLVPIQRSGSSETIPVHEAELVPSPATGTIGSDRELIIVRMSVPVPETVDMIVDVEATLVGPDGMVLAPHHPPKMIVGDYAHLNRVQYVPSAADTTP